MGKKVVIGLVAMIGLVAIWQTDAEAQCLQWRTIGGSSMCVAWATKGVQCKVTFKDGCFVTQEGTFVGCEADCRARNTDTPTSIAFCTAPSGIVGVPCDQPFSFGPARVGFGSAVQCFEHADNESPQGEAHERHRCEASATLPPNPENFTSGAVCCANAGLPFAGDLTPVEMTARVDAVDVFGGGGEVPPPSCAPGSPNCTIEETCSINPKKIRFIPPTQPELGKQYQCNIECVGVGDGPGQCSPLPD